MRSDGPCLRPVRQIQDLLKHLSFKQQCSIFKIGRKMIEPGLRETILVVDDSPEQLFTISSILKDDYDVKVAKTGAKALEYTSSHKPVDLILLDIMMPDMDGYEVCRRLKSDSGTYEIPVIFLTGKTDEESEIKGLEAGAVDYITKPVSPPILLSRIRTHLQLKRITEHLKSKLELEEKFTRREVTIMLTDLRGFTSMSETFPARMMLDLLNRYFARMSEVIMRSQGTIDKFMGDGILVLFGAPFSRPDDARRAVACAVEMQIAMDELNAYHKKLGLPEFFMGIGINTGMVMAGLLGSDIHAEYTVIGKEVNLTARIEAFSLRGQVLISESTLDRCRGFVITDDPIDVLVKGKPKPVNLYEVLGIPSLGLEPPRKEMRKSPRVEVNIPFTYQLVVNKIVMPQERQGIIRDMSYHGILSELGDALSARSDIKMSLDMSLLGYKAADVYAKVLNCREADGCFQSGMEFTSVSVQSEMNIRRFVQLLVQSRDIR